ncbi:hypothetical protein [Acinetobacter sp. CFCC 10889]|uniref:hypothetical protein n=1 Tax=Acinetobacter sp. CFCC 10889 TaxID=1775557 RepID=UPI000DCF7937|nr:hypothetical protein [Acinetobacter sp. CFCC 10889]
MSLGQWVLVLLAIGIFFYLGIFLGYRIAHVFVTREIASGNKFLIGSHLYRGYYQCDLSNSNELPESFFNIPASTNQVIHQDKS